MDDFNTYNQVQVLESGLPRLFFNLVYGLLALTFVTATLLALTLAHYWLLILAGLCAALTGLAFWLDVHRSRRCRHCGTELVSIVRPFKLSADYLAMRGVKTGDYFYCETTWGMNPLNKRWARISQQSLCCRHCRIFEERTHKVYEAASSDEIASARETLASH